MSQRSIQNKKRCALAFFFYFSTIRREEKVTMSHFSKSTTCVPQGIGQLLQQTREYHGLQLEDIAEVLCIQKQNLEHLERNAFSCIPETLYRELFLKTYSTYLGLNWEHIREQYHTECQIYASGDAAHSSACTKNYIRKTSFWVTPKIIRNSFLALGIGSGLAYIIFLGWNTLQPPHLVIFQPQTEFSLSNTEEILVSGQTKKEAQVAINGQAVIKKQDGTFAQDVALSDGLNIITITVSKKFSRPQSLTRKVLFEKRPQSFSYKNP